MKEFAINLAMVAVVSLGLSLAINYSNTDLDSHLTITGVTDAGIEVSATRVCLDGKLYIKNYGAVLDDFGAPMKCVYDERLVK